MCVCVAVGESTSFYISTRPTGFVWPSVPLALLAVCVCVGLCSVKCAVTPERGREADRSGLGSRLTESPNNMRGLIVS